MQPELTIDGGSRGLPVRVGGSIDARSARVFGAILTQDARALSLGDDGIDLDLADLELDDGQAVVEAVNAIRSLLADGPVVLRHAPQMLAHTLYKVGLLADGQLELVAPREEEPAAY